MAGYNYFPTYQPMQYPYQNQQSNGGIIWVQGESGAKSYLVAPNNTVQLWDSEAQVIYLKSADASGMPSIKILDYTIRENQSQGLRNTPIAQQADFPTRKEFEALKGQIQAIRNELGMKEESNEPTV